MPIGNLMTNFDFEIGDINFRLTINDPAADESIAAVRLLIQQSGGGYPDRAEQGAFFSITNPGNRSQADLDRMFDEGIAKINDYILKKLGATETPDMPENGYARLVWLVENGISIVDNKMVVNRP